MTDRLLRRPEVERLTGLSRSTIYAQMSKDEFPHPIKITGKAAAWRGPDIEAWIASRPMAGPQAVTLPQGRARSA